MQIVGRSLQYLGLICLPVAIVIELGHLLGPDFGLSQMLMMMIFGFCAFQLGRYIEGFAIGEQD